MKKIVIISSIILLGISPMFSQNVNIPDANFLNALIYKGFDTNGDKVISYAEAEAVTSLDVSNKSISDVTGIEAFVNLTSLNCISNQLTSLDFSNNAVLTSLSCESNQLTSLDVSNNAVLTSLSCESNQLTSLDVSNNTALKGLSCENNQLTSLDVSNCTALFYLSCPDNQLTSLDVSTCTALTYLYCSDNQLTSLDVSNNTALTELDCPHNQLTSLDVSNCTALTYLYCPDNHLTSLDVSNCTALTYLDCPDNHLTSLDVSNCTALTYLECPDNQLTSLDVSNCTALEYLWCDENQLTSLDVSNNTSIRYLILPNMPTLFRVCVWEMPFPPYGVNIDITGSPNIYFTTECTVDINTVKIKKGLIYPNPSNGIINIDIDNPLDAYIEIYNINGRMIYSKPPISDQEKIDLSAYPEGVYFVKVKHQGVLKVGKVVMR